jgi:hypothetical protein
VVLLARRQEAGRPRGGDSPGALIEGKCGNGKNHGEWEAKLRNQPAPDLNPLIATEIETITEKEPIAARLTAVSADSA